MNNVEITTERMAAAARELQDQHDAQATLRNAVALLVQNVEGCQAAGIAVVRARRGGVVTQAATSDMVVASDRLQFELDEGPCLDAIWQQETVYAPDLATDPRWPTWGPQVAFQTNVRSILSYRLFTLRDTLGALNMYSSQPDAFSTEDMAEGLALAAHIAIALAAVQKLDQFQTALSSRTVIAQACGIAMERFDLDAARAFALLTRLSSNENSRSAPWPPRSSPRANYQPRQGRQPRRPGTDVGLSDPTTRGRAKRGCAGRGDGRRATVLLPGVADVSAPEH